MINKCSQPVKHNIFNNQFTGVYASMLGLLGTDLNDEIFWKVTTPIDIRLLSDLIRLSLRAVN
jgi:hypothetical protein